VADLKGLKVRTAGDDAAILSSMGASPVQIAVGEIYEAVQRGVLDGFQLNTPYVDISFATHEIADYMIMSPVRQPNGLSNFIINGDTWTNIPDDLKILIRVCVLAGVSDAYGRWINGDLEAIQFFKDYGTNIVTLPKEIEDEFIRQTTKYYDEELAVKDPLAAEVIASKRAFQKAVREAWQRL
jgi:TRAP-type mannitol/chloroaromatic compound transport system substrate-binding protein